MTSSESVPFLQLPQDMLPLPPLKAQPECPPEHLLVISARRDMRDGIERIIQDIGNDCFKVDKRQWHRIQRAIEDISKHGDPDDLFETTMDFLYVAQSWLEARWSGIQKS